jgi:Tfp pilus assembly protein PilN
MKSFILFTLHGSQFTVKSMFEKRSLGIAFEADGTVKVAELTSNMRTVILSRAWTIQPGSEENIDSWKQAIDHLRESKVDLDNAVIGIPDSLIYRKHLSFPFSNRKRIMQILNSELDGEIPLSIDTVVADFIAGQPVGSGLHGTAMACDKSILSRFLDITGPGVRLKSVQTGSVGLATASIRAGMMDGAAVQCGPGEAVLVEFRSSKVKTIKRLALTMSDERNAQLLVEGIRQHAVDGDEIYLGCGDLYDQVRAGLNGEGTLHIKTLADLDIVQRATDVDVDQDHNVSAIGLALSGLGTSEALLFDLRQGSFKQLTPLAGLRGSILRTSALLLIVGFLGVTSLVTSLNQARNEYQNLKNQLELEFKELFPGSKPIDGQESAQIKGELDDLKRKMGDLSGLEGRGALSVLAGLSAAIPADISIKLDELSYDSKKLRLEGVVSSFDMVDRIKGALDSEPLFAEVQVQNARVGANINKVTFRLQMEVR